MNLTPEYMARLRELMQLKLLNVRFEEDSPLAILKYSKRAFWTSAWNKHPELLQTRGMIVDWRNGRIVAMPFPKVFNHGETEESKTMFRDDEEVLMVQKVNGFLGIATYDEVTDHVIICSSGTFDSEFCEMAKEYLDNDAITAMLKDHKDITFMFEICHPNDPHIIKEKFGAHLIGARTKQLDSRMMYETFLDVVFSSYLYADDTNEFDIFHRPLWSSGTFKSVTNNRHFCMNEGYMVRALRNDGRALKIKSVHYLTLKFLSRSNKTAAIWDDPDNFLKTIDEDFHEIVRVLPSVATKEEWAEMNDQARLKILNQILRNSKI